jgi:hypothetical protein
MVLPKLKSVEDKILYINFRKDQQQKSLNFDDFKKRKNLF